MKRRATIDENKTEIVKRSTNFECDAVIPPDAPKTTLVDLNEDCLRHIFDYLTLEESLRVAQTCTRLFTVARQMLPHKHHTRWIYIDARKLTSNGRIEADNYDQKIRCVSWFPNFEINFFDDPSGYELCDRLFSIFCDSNIDHIENLKLFGLILPQQMPKSMIQFFQTVSVGELYLWRCSLRDIVSFPNVMNLKTTRCFAVTNYYPADFINALDGDNLNIHLQECANWKALSIYLRTAHSFSRNILCLFDRATQLECVSFSGCDMLIFDDFVFKTVTKLKNIQTLRLDFYATLPNPAGNNRENRLVEMIRQTPSLEEIEINLIEFNGFISNCTFHRLLAICRANGRKIKLSFVVKFAENPSVERIMAEFVGSEEYKREIDKHLEIDVSLLPVIRNQVFEFDLLD